MVNSERNLTLFQQAVEPPGQALPDWQIIARIACAMGYSDAFSYRLRRGGLRRDQAVLEPHDRLRPARRQLRPAAARHRCSGRARPTASSRPQSRSATSTTASARPGWSARTAACPGWRSRPPSGRAVFFARPHLSPDEMPDDDLPVPAQHRSAAAPMAHDDQDRQGRQAQQAQPRTVRRDSPRRRRAAADLATATRSRSPPAAAAPCCPPWSPTGCGPATASRRSTGMTCSANTCRSTPSPTTPSTRYRASRNSRRARSR